MNGVPGPSERRPSAAFFVFGKVLPAALFTFLALVQLELLRVDIANAGSALHDPRGLSFLFNRGLSIAFPAGVALVYVVRRPPLRGRHDIPAVLVSMYASFILLALLPLHRLWQVQFVSLPDWTLVVANVLVAGGAAFAVFALLYLRLNFSILPEARGLTTGGPYRLVRHPVYLGEIIGGAGLALSLPSWLSAVVLASFVAFQLVRTRMEEQVLGDSLPGYAEYAARTPRLFPFLRV